MAGIAPRPSAAAGMAVAAGALLVYDVTARESYNHVGMWLNDARTMANPDVSLILVGNVEFDGTGNIVPGTYPISFDDMIEDAFDAGYCVSFMNSPFPSGR